MAKNNNLNFCNKYQKKRSPFPKKKVKNIMKNQVKKFLYYMVTADLTKKLTVN